MSREWLPTVSPLDRPSGGHLPRVLRGQARRRAVREGQVATSCVVAPVSCVARSAGDFTKRWSPDRNAVEFGIGVGEYEGVVRVSRRVFQILLPETPTPERCLEAYHLHRIRLELIAERKVRRRQLTDDGNIEITGRDMRDRAAPPTARRDWSSAGGYIRAARERCLRWPPPRRCGDRR